MIYKKVQLDDSAFLDVYVADATKDFTRKAILVIPGGGYGNVCSDREGEPIGMAFMPYGYNAFVLHYSVKEKPFPHHLIQASMAIKHIRDNAEEYNIDPDKVFAVGFSAGGHLAGSLGTMWHKDEIYEAVKMPYGYNKPNGVMLIYPVITGLGRTHKGSFINLLMTENPTEEQLKAVSIENNVDEKSSPMFIMHTSNDDLVNVRNSLVLAEALAKQDIKFELHIYPDAPHGIALGNKITSGNYDRHENVAISKWIENAAVWADGLE